MLASGDSPVDLVKLARVRAGAVDDEYDQVWCVVDVDHFDLSAAASAARAAKVRFEQFADGVEQAVGRARALDASGLNYARNPSTGVWRLVEEMRRHLGIP